MDMFNNVYQESIWALLAQGWMELKCLHVALQLTLFFLRYVSLIIHLFEFITQEHPKEPRAQPTHIPVILLFILLVYTSIMSRRLELILENS